ncbi:MAG TPA: ribonuclease HII [Candidatus Woesearchaeota archaeon]|nr:ribonuclease HII [Candidatus Woesearchaeota archaeon]
MIIAGIDEAGRGPVVGPMVVAIAIIDSEKQGFLSELGVKDSKKLSPAARERILSSLSKALIEYKIKIIYPPEIDLAVESEGYNLNLLECDAMAFLLNEVKSRPEAVYIDLPSTNSLSFTSCFVSKLREYNKKVKVIAEHKADDAYPVVSAASVIAKVARDKEIKELEKKYNVRIGSGYPADPVTKEFIQKNYSKYPFFRKSWQTYKNLSKPSKEKSLESFFKKK